MVLLLAGFVSCSNPNNGDSGGNSSGGTTSGKALATYKSTGDKAKIYMTTLDGPIFYYFKENGVFSTTVVHKGKTFELLKGTYTGDATKDGEITITIQDYADVMYIGLKKEQHWKGESAPATAFTITDGKGLLPVYYDKDIGFSNNTMNTMAEFTRQ